jgi:hypothetical protein
MKPFAFVLLVMIPSLAFGRLGETEAQLVTRFGMAISRAKEITLTQWEDRRIRAQALVSSGRLDY